MTATPLTDDLARGNHVVPTEFAQELERRLMEQCKLLAMSADREERLRAELEEIQIKGERLHWAWQVAAGKTTND